MSKPQKKGKYSFTLKDVNVGRINTTYGINATDEDSKDFENQSNTTKLIDLNSDKYTPEMISFLDEAKCSHICHISMIDFQSRISVNLLRYHCFWCRHPFETRPIGCPIKYVSSQAEKKYFSHISRDTYTIKENITSAHVKSLEEVPELTIKHGEYYETDGVFCSFNCCQSWIDNNKHDRLYDMSKVLLMKMYNTMMNTKTVIISPAPHWRTLEQYGGHLNIIKFREGFNKIEYKYHGTSKPIPKFLPIGSLFEENIKF